MIMVEENFGDPLSHPGELSSPKMQKATSVGTVRKGNKAEKVKKIDKENNKDKGQQEEKNEAKRVSFSKASFPQIIEQAKTVDKNGAVVRSASLVNSRPPSLKRKSFSQPISRSSSPFSRTPSAAPLPRSQSLPTIKITDYDEGTEEYITDYSRYDYIQKTDSPYGLGDLNDGLPEKEDDNNEDDDNQNDDEENETRYDEDDQTEDEEEDSRYPLYDGDVFSEEEEDLYYLEKENRLKEEQRKEEEAEKKNKKGLKKIPKTEKILKIKDPSIRPTSSITFSQFQNDKNKKLNKKKELKSLRRHSFSEMSRTKNDYEKSDYIKSIINPKDKVPPQLKLLEKKKLAAIPKAPSEGDYAVSVPQGDDLYNPTSRPVSLPPLNKSEPAGRRGKTKVPNEKGKKNSTLYPYIHGLTRTIDSRGSSAKSSRLPSAATIRSSKDDSRIQYEVTPEEQKLIKPIQKTSVPYRAKKIRIYRNGDRYFGGFEYTFKAGRDVLNLEGLCDKISDRIGLPRGARYIFGLDGTRKFRLEELQNGQSYVASSDRKFLNLAYNKNRPGWNSKSNPDNNNNGPKSRSGSPVVKLAGKRGDSSDSGNSTGSSTGKPGSREGRTIKVINTADKTQEVSVLVNMKTVQAWEDVVADLGQVLKMKGEMKLYTSGGQEVKSFSQFKNDYADYDTFFLKSTSEERTRKITLSRPTSATATESGATPRRKKPYEEKKNTRSRLGKAPKTNLRRFASEPMLGETPEEQEDIVVADGSAVSIVVHGNRRVFYPPKAPVTHNPTPPACTLALDWVYGYRGTDTKKNLWVVATEELLYFVAAVAVLYDRKHDSQRHYTEHTEDIQCMALHPTRDIVASGQRAARGSKMTAHVRVWSIKSLNTLHVLGEMELGVGIMAVAFSKKNKGQYLLAVEADQEHLLSVWTWETEKIFGKVATHLDYVYGACFHPLDSNLIIIFGKGLLSLWTRRKDGIFTKSLLLKDTHIGKVITCVEFSSAGDLVTGDGDGQIAVWSVDLEGHYFIKMEYTAHEGPIASLQKLSEGTILSGGEKDRKIIAWDSDEDFEKVEETRLPELAGGVRTLYPQRPGESDGNIYVGTTRNMILEGSLQRRFNQIVFGHSKQLWGLAVNKNDGIVATAGYDKHIIKWRNTKLDWRIQAQGECVSVAIHPFSTVVVAGTIDGHLIVLNALTGMHVVTVRVCGSPISCLTYNHTGDTLAAGSQNGSLYLFRSTKDGFVYSRHGRMSGFQPLSGIDWSESGNFLQTVTSDNDIAYWNLKDLTLVKNPLDIRNESWATQNCPLGYMIHGIWGGKKNSPVQVSVDRHDRKKLLVAGDTDGYIRLYRYPVLSDQAGYHEYKVYTSYLSSARFSTDEDYLYTTGGTDAAFMRWRIE